MRTATLYQWMDWSQDGCSAPPGLDFSHREIFKPGCLRHNLVYRTLAVTDRATGKVWNERNRFRADMQFLWDNKRECAIRHSTPHTEGTREGCDIVANGYFAAVRVGGGGRGLLPSPSEALSVYDSSYPGMKLMSSSSCAGSSNRCLPIAYVERNDRPFAPQNYNIIPTDTAIEISVIRANLQSVGGVPDPSHPAGQMPRGYQNTGTLLVRVASPFIISISRDLSCTNQGNLREMYAGVASYNPATHTDDTSLKYKTFYLKACSAVTAASLTEAKMELLPAQTRRARGSSRWEPNIDDRFRHYQHMDAQAPKASFAPRPDTNIVIAEDTWYGPLVLDTVAPLASVDVVANPNDDTPLLEITTSRFSSNYCNDSADKDNTLPSVDDGESIWIAMCSPGTSTLELRHPTTGHVVNTYVAGLAEPATPTLSIPTGLTATAGTSRDAFVILRWTPAANATSYEVQQWFPIIRDWVILGDTISFGTTSATVRGLVNGQTHYFRVRGKNGDQVSTWSAQENATPTVTVGNPTNLRGTGYSNGTVVLRWSAGSNALEYEVKQWDGRAVQWRVLPFTETGPGFSESYTIVFGTNRATISGLPRSVCYSHNVRAKNGMIYSPGRVYVHLSCTQ